MTLTSSSPQKQSEAVQTNNTMPRPFAPKQILQKKQISKQESSFQETRTPETVRDYQVSPDKPASKEQQQQQQHQATTTGPVNFLGRGPNRRSHLRSSSLFEEWKARCVHDPGKTKESTVTSPVMPKARDNWKADGSITFADTRGRLGDHSEKAANFQLRNKPVNDGRGRQPEAGKTDNRSADPSSPAPSVRITGTPITNTAATTKKGPNRRGRFNNRQGDRESQQHSQERQQEQVAYTAPNGCCIGKGELKALSRGIKLEGKDRVYFLPCFIEDPWKDLKPTPAIHSA
ncbi:hypothetical protein BDW59DRAFT_155790 [Aspergillus cavernicola]|uniref:Uncharacterized protein n=1 Tax=Aspergillus cavernicola TaxID=176166 RepID=A0ABR4J4J0_9EURO